MPPSPLVAWTRPAVRAVGAVGALCRCSVVELRVLALLRWWCCCCGAGGCLLYVYLHLSTPTSINVHQRLPAQIHYKPCLVPLLLCSSKRCLVVELTISNPSQVAVTSSSESVRLQAPSRPAPSTSTFNPHSLPICNQRPTSITIPGRPSPALTLQRCSLHPPFLRRSLHALARARPNPAAPRPPPSRLPCCPPTRRRYLCPSPPPHTHHTHIHPHPPPPPPPSCAPLRRARPPTPAAEQ